MYGKSLRLSRLMNSETKRFCIVPIDHGVTYGPIDGIGNYISLINGIVDSGADAIILHKGLLKAVSKYPELGKGRYIMHISASTIQSPELDFKVLVSSVEEAIKLGADGVSVQVNLGTLRESEMIRDLGMVSNACMEWGMPLLAMMYTCGEHSSIVHAARVAEELGADIVKISCPRSVEEIVEIISYVHIPVLIAGGAKMKILDELFVNISNALYVGIAGVVVGRNIFQHSNPKLISSLISNLVHGKMRVEECIFQLKELMVNE